MRTRAVQLAIALSAVCSTAPAPVLEFDHVYVVVTPGAAAEVEALRRVGLIVDSVISRHDGEGTASRAAFFDNGYLELLWVDSSVTVDSVHGRDFEDFQRAAAWRRSGASPFGIGLHFVSGTPADLPIPVRLDSASFLRPGTYYVLLRQPAESLGPDVFIMPDDRAVPSWIARFRTRKPDLFAHSLGARRITQITLRAPAGQKPRAAQLDTRLVRFAEASSLLLELQLDGGQLGKTWDLRPALPLIIQR